VDDLEWFWDAIWKFFDIQAATAPPAVLAGSEMPGVQWFPGATLNYVTEIFRHAVDGRPAMVVAGEDGSSEWSWERLRQETAAFAANLRSVGVEPGDRVVGYLPNIGEFVVAFLGAGSVGATWACNQDLAVSGVVARLGQLEPTVLVASDGSVYADKRRDRHAELAEIRSQLPTLRATVLVPRLGEPVSRHQPGPLNRSPPRTARGPCASWGPGPRRPRQAGCRRAPHGSAVPPIRGLSGPTDEQPVAMPRMQSRVQNRAMTEPEDADKRAVMR
jgi:acetoacetyl-CoA synthetase